MILVDASAWVEFDRGTESATHRRLRSLISSGGEMAVSEPILMEVLVGARHREAESRLRRLLTSFSWIPVEAAADFEGCGEDIPLLPASGDHAPRSPGLHDRINRHPFWGHIAHCRSGL